MGIVPSVFAATAAPAATGIKKEADVPAAKPSATALTAAAAAAAAAPETAAAAKSVAAAAPAAPAAPAVHVPSPAELEMMRILAEEEAQFNDKKPKENETEKEDEKWPPHQCGLEDDDIKWKPKVRDPRIKESRLSAELRAKFQGHLDIIFSDITLLGKKFVFEPEDVVEVMDKVILYLGSEPMLIEDVPFGVNVVGDLHGQLYDLDRIFKIDAKDGKPGWECAKYVFLGDYVDRGRQSLEVIMALFCIKMLHPDRIFILRGNHEFMATNMRYGSIEDLFDRYTTETTVALYLKMNNAFCYMSVAAIVGNIYFCAHGGISQNGFTRRQLRGIYKPYVVCNQDSLIKDICWADPAEGLRGSTFNKARESSIYFGFDALCHALESMEVIAIFRAHQCMKAGVEISWNCCFSIFSATDYGFAGNKGGVGVIDELGRVSFKILEVDTARSKWEEALEDFELGLPLKADLDSKIIAVGHDDAGVGHVEKM